MSFLSELRAQETPAAKVVKAGPITFVGHIPADELEARLDALKAALPEGWKDDADNVLASKNPVSGRYTRYLHVKGTGTNLTVFSTGSVTIVNPAKFAKAWGELAELGIVEGKAPARKN